MCVTIHRPIDKIIDILYDGVERTSIAKKMVQSKMYLFFRHHFSHIIIIIYEIWIEEEIVAIIYI